MPRDRRADSPRPRRARRRCHSHRAYPKPSWRLTSLGRLLGRGIFEAELLAEHLANAVAREARHPRRLRIHVRVHLLLTVERLVLDGLLEDLAVLPFDDRLLEVRHLDLLVLLLPD